uniref:Uncharacterized protein n=1 Tax=Knipowitschia caucasica TaxID=637954 RepID=A0AAV2JLH2_KNICA
MAFSLLWNCAPQVDDCTDDLMRRRNGGVGRYRDDSELGFGSQGFISQIDLEENVLLSFRVIDVSGSGE